MLPVNANAAQKRIPRLCFQCFVLSTKKMAKQTYSIVKLVTKKTIRILGILFYLRICFCLLVQQ
jgi:hypothetical protein